MFSLLTSGFRHLQAIKNLNMKRGKNKEDQRGGGRAPWRNQEEEEGIDEEQDAEEGNLGGIEMRMKVGVDGHDEEGEELGGIEMRMVMRKRS